MTSSTLETTDIFRGDFYLCMGGHLEDIRFNGNGKEIASFMFTGPNPAGSVTACTYDRAGNLSSKTDAENQTTRYFYDAAGRLTTIEYCDEGGTPVKTVTYTYDAAGRLTGYDDGTTSGEYTYDVNRHVKMYQKSE